MKKLLLIPLLLIFVAIGVANIQEQKQLNDTLDIQLDQKQIRINALHQKMLELDKALDEEKGNSEQNKEKIKKLEEEKQQLEKDLQAKLERKRQEAIAHANLEKAALRATGTATASASGNCATWIAQAGISDTANAIELIRRESNCNPNAVNSSSGACGVAQELPCGKSGCSMGDGACQVKWMNNYVSQRYGSWANAVAFHNANNWY
jgi:hypothetical protein